MTVVTVGDPSMAQALDPSFRRTRPPSTEQASCVSGAFGHRGDWNMFGFLSHLLGIMFLIYWEYGSIYWE